MSNQPMTQVTRQICVDAISVAAATDSVTRSQVEAVSAFLALGRSRLSLTHRLPDARCAHRQVDVALLEGHGHFDPMAGSASGRYGLGSVQNSKPASALFTDLWPKRPPRVIVTGACHGGTPEADEELALYLSQREGGPHEVVRAGSRDREPVYMTGLLTAVALAYLDATSDCPQHSQMLSTSTGTVMLLDVVVDSSRRLLAFGRLRGWHARRGQCTCLRWDQATARQFFADADLQRYVEGAAKVARKRAHAEASAASPYAEPYLATIGGLTPNSFVTPAASLNMNVRRLPL